MKKIKPSIIRTILLSLALFLALMYLYVKKSPRDFKEIASSKVIRIATEYNAIGFYVNGDSIAGFQYELAKMVEKRFGIKVEITPVMTLEESVKGLIGKQYDIIARPVPKTTELLTQFAFTHPIIYNKQVLVQRYDSTCPKLVRNQINLGKKTIYVTKNSPAILRIKNLSSEIGDTIYISEEEKYSDEQLIAWVARGKIEYAACDYSIAKKQIKLYNNLNISTDISFTQLQSWMVRKNSPVLLDSLNRWIKEIKRNGEFKRLYLKYY